MPATREAIAEALREGSPWNDGEKSLIKWQIGQHGDFKTALWAAISKADLTNLRRLQLGYPEEVAAFIEWSRGELATLFRNSGLDL